MASAYLFLILNIQLFINPFSAISNFVESGSYNSKTEGANFQIGIIKEDPTLRTIQNLRGLNDSVFKTNIDKGLASGETYWIKITNKNKVKNKHYLLQLRDLVDRIDVFCESDSLNPGFSGGIASTYSERKIAGLGYSSAYFEVDRTSTVFARIKTIEGIPLHPKSIKVTSFQVFEKLWMKEGICQNFFIGILTVFIILLLILSSISKRKYQLYFALFILSIDLQWLFMYNLTELFTGNFPRFELFMNWMAFLDYIFFLLFVREFFKLKTTHGKLYRVVGWIVLIQAAIAVAAITMFFIHIAIFIQIIVVYGIAGTLIGLVLLFFLRKNLTSAQKIIFAGITLLLITNMSFVLTAFFTGNYYGHHYFQTSVILILMAMVTSLGIGAFEHLNLFKQQTDTIKQVTKKTESLEIENTLMQSEIEEHEKQLGAKNLQLVQVTEMIRSVENNNPSLKTNQDYRKWKESTSDLTQNWQEFDMWFNKSNELFFQKLHSRHPNLTINERRLCGFLKLDMSTKDMAEIMKKSTNTIDVARYRLRQKLGLPSNININSYILGIENGSSEISGHEEE